MIVTFEQAKKLKELGFDEKVHKLYYEGTVRDMAYESNFNQNLYGGLYISAPTVSEALQWIRDKVITDGIHIWVELNRSFKYIGMLRYKEDMIEHEMTESFATHPEAESALLDELLDYLKNKE